MGDRGKRALVTGRASESHTLSPSPVINQRSSGWGVRLSPPSPRGVGGGGGGRTSGIPNAQTFFFPASSRTPTSRVMLTVSEGGKKQGRNANGTAGKKKEHLYRKSDLPLRKRKKKSFLKTSRLVNNTYVCACVFVCERPREPQWVKHKGFSTSACHGGQSSA